MAIFTKSAAPTAIVRTSLDLPSTLIDDYSAKAISNGVSADELIISRLTKCQDHDSLRPLYLNDADREQVEQLLGGGMFNSPAELIKALQNSYTVSIGGAPIRLEPQVYTLLKDRAEETGTTLRAMVIEICTNALSDYATGGH